MCLFGKDILNTTAYHLNCYLFTPKPGSHIALTIVMAVSSVTLLPPTPSIYHTAAIVILLKWHFVPLLKPLNGFPLKVSAKVLTVALKVLYNLSDLPLDPPNTFVIHLPPSNPHAQCYHTKQLAVYRTCQALSCLRGLAFVVPLSGSLFPQICLHICGSLPHLLQISKVPFSERPSLTRQYKIVLPFITIMIALTLFIFLHLYTSTTDI